MRLEDYFSPLAYAQHLPEPLKLVYRNETPKGIPAWFLHVLWLVWFLPQRVLPSNSGRQPRVLAITGNACGSMWPHWPTTQKKSYLFMVEGILLASMRFLNFVTYKWFKPLPDTRLRTYNVYLKMPSLNPVMSTSSPLNSGLWCL